MIHRLYVHNFRCLENFELRLSGQSSMLLIGKNGAGKSTIRVALELLQKIARGGSRVADLLHPTDPSQGRSGVPVRFLIEVELEGKLYSYEVAFELPKGFKEFRVFEEKLSVDGHAVYSRDLALVHLAKSGADKAVQFRMDWHQVALPIVKLQSASDPIANFMQWLSRMLILRPIPSQIGGHSHDETLNPDPEGKNLGAWFAGLMANTPAAYGIVIDYLKQIMPDIEEITNLMQPTGSRSLKVRFSNQFGSTQIPFENLSDGEKCFVLSALVLASNKVDGPLFCFWDEPDNYLSLDEVGHFVASLRKAFQSGGQLIATTHNDEAIRQFSDKNTLYLDRKSHLEPAIVRRVSDLHLNGDLVGALIRGDV